MGKVARSFHFGKTFNPMCQRLLQNPCFPKKQGRISPLRATSLHFLLTLSEFRRHGLARRFSQRMDRNEWFLKFPL